MDESKPLEEIRYWEHPPWYGRDQFKERSNWFSRREKNNSLFHWNTLMYPELQEGIWMSSKRNASMIFGILTGQEICLLLGQVSLNLLYWKKNLQTDIYIYIYIWSGERLTKRQATSRPDHLWPELWIKVRRNAKLKEKQKSQMKEPKLDNAKRLPEI